MCGPIAEERETGVGQRLSVESRVIQSNKPNIGQTRVFRDSGGFIVIVTEGVPTNLYLGTNAVDIRENARRGLPAGNILTVEELLKIGYQELTVQPPVPEQPKVDRLKAAEEATGYELGDAVQFYSSISGNYEVGRVIGFARVNNVDFLTGSVDREGEGERNLVIEATGSNYVVHPNAVSSFDANEPTTATTMTISTDA